jgi:hypothetical protein
VLDDDVLGVVVIGEHGVGVVGAIGADEGTTLLNGSADIVDFE